jgi:hypothetical protein
MSSSDASDPGMMRRYVLVVICEVVVVAALWLVKQVYSI